MCTKAQALSSHLATLIEGLSPLLIVDLSRTPMLLHASCDCLSPRSLPESHKAPLRAADERPAETERSSLCEHTAAPVHSCDFTSRRKQLHGL